VAVATENMSLASDLDLRTGVGAESSALALGPNLGFDAANSTWGTTPVHAAALTTKGRAHPVFTTLVSFGVGELEHEANGFTDDTGALSTRLRLEGGRSFGGGVLIEGSWTDDDLFGNNEATAVEIFPYLVGTPTCGTRFRIPCRLGPHIGGYELNHVPTDRAELWANFGLRLEVEPEVAVIKNETFEWSFYGNLNASAGYTLIDSDALDETFDSEYAFLGGEIGSRMMFKALSAGLFFFWRTAQYDQSDPEIVLGVPRVIPETDVTQTGIAFMVGIRL
jgi:hypothetical protein